MLAFRPEEAASREPLPVPQRAASSSIPRAASVTAPAAVVQSATVDKVAASGGEWSDLLARLQLQGPVQQLAAHCVFVAATQDTVRLRLDRSGEYFRRPQLEQKLAQALSTHYGRTMRLEIALSDAAEPTPARQQQAASDERLKAAQLAIDSDPAVRAMRDVFGATVQPGSVKPIE